MSVYYVNLILGQSFMLHQIRKMVGVVIAICRGVTNIDVIENSWLEERLDLPIAPGLGLVLEEVHYDKYNEKFGNDGMHERLDFVELNDKVAAFRAKYILPTIIKVEKEESSYPLKITSNLSSIFVFYMSYITYYLHSNKANIIYICVCNVILN